MDLAPLAPLAAPELVAQSVAHALGLRIELDRKPHGAIFSFLAARQVLLVLDNCEHLADACADLVSRLLQSCPAVTVLATGREPLGVEGEMLWRLGPLEEADAVRLFLDRARAQRAELDAGDDVIRQLCLALDCLPLALELAAARVSLLAPAEILPRLHNRFELLRRVGGRGGAPRQQTLRATIDWSYELLEPTERQLFRRLAVFAGPFDLATVAAFGSPDSLDVLGRLVDKSLVLAQIDERGTRYRLPDTLREYAWQQLHQAGEVEIARQRHLEHFLGRAETLFNPNDSLDGPTRELDAELDNLRGAFEWCLETDPYAGLRLVGLTRDVWWRRSFAEGRRWSRVFLNRCPDPSLARAQALCTAASVEVLGDPAEARRLLTEARELAARFDTATLASVDYLLGFAAFSDEHADQAIYHFERALSEITGVDIQRRSLPLHIGWGWALLTDRHRREEGRRRLERAYEHAQQLGDRHSAGAADFGLGLYWRWTGHPLLALDHFRRVLVPLRGLQVIPTIAATLLHIARLLAPSEPVKAARLSGAGLAMAERAGVHIAERLTASMDQIRVELVQRLGNEHADRAWTSGQSLTVDEIVTLALETTPCSSSIPSSNPMQAVVGSAGLMNDS